MVSTIIHTESVEFSASREDIGTDEHGFDPVSEPGAAQTNAVTDYLVGKEPLQRETHWSKTGRTLRKSDWDDSGTNRTGSIHVSG